jgi:hypothetical protein
VTARNRPRGRPSLCVEACALPARHALEQEWPGFAVGPIHWFDWNQSSLLALLRAEAGRYFHGLGIAPAPCAALPRELDLIRDRAHRNDSVAGAGRRQNGNARNQHCCTVLHLALHSCHARNCAARTARALSTGGLMPAGST